MYIKLVKINGIAFKVSGIKVVYANVVLQSIFSMLETGSKMKWFGIATIPVLLCSLVAWILAASYENSETLKQKIGTVRGVNQNPDSSTILEREASARVILREPNQVVPRADFDRDNAYLETELQHSLDSEKKLRDKASSE